MEWDESKCRSDVLEGTMESVDDRAYHDSVSAIGKNIKDALMAGKTVEDHLYIDLIVAKIRLVAAQANNIASKELKQMLVLHAKNTIMMSLHTEKQC